MIAKKTIHCKTVEDDQVTELNEQPEDDKPIVSESSKDVESPSSQMKI